MTNNYYCYNPIKKDFLLTQNIMYIDNDTHKKTNKSYWIYARTSELDKALLKWREYQQSKYN